MGNYVGNTISKALGTKVTAGHIGVDFPNRIYIDDLYIEDQKGDTLLFADRAAVNGDFIKLAKEHKISNLSVVQLLGARIRINEDKDGKLNCQFLLDSLASDNQEKSEKFSIDDIIVRGADIRYCSPTRQTNLHELDLTARNLCVDGKRITGNAYLSTNGQELAVRGFEYDNELIKVAEVEYKKGHNNALLSKVKYDLKNNSFSGNATNVDIVPSDFAAFLPSLNKYNVPIHVDGDVIGDTEFLRLSGVNFRTQDNSLAASTETLQIDGYNNISAAKIRARDARISMTEGGSRLLSSLLNLDEKTKNILLQLGNMNASADVIVQGGTYRIGNGALASALGNISAEGIISGNNINAHISGNDVKLGQIISEATLGRSDFNLQIIGNDAMDVKGDINLLEYKGYPYKNIHIDGTGSKTGFDGTIIANDPNLIANINTSINLNGKTININNTDASLSANRMSLYPLLGNDAPNSVSLDAHIDQTTFDEEKSLQGDFNIIHAYLNTDKERHELNNASLSIHKNNIDISSDFVNAKISGNIDYSSLLNGLQNQLAMHLPSLVSHKPRTSGAYDFDISINDNEYLSKLLKDDVKLLSPAHLHGRINNDSRSMTAHVETDKIKYGSMILSDCVFDVDNNSDAMNVLGTAVIGEDKNAVAVDIDSRIHDNLVDANLKWNSPNGNTTNGTLAATSQFTDSLGHLNTKVNIHSSKINYDNLLWNVNPSAINIYRNKIICHNVDIHSGDRYVNINGIASDNPEDSIIAKLHGFDVGYVVGFTNFHAVKFGGNISGTAAIRNILGTPDISAHLLVDDFSLEGSVLGLADIRAKWDNQLKGAHLFAHIVDEEPISKPNKWPVSHITDVSGHIAPRSIGRDDVVLNINAQRTNAEFLNSFIGGIFDDVKGDVSGLMTVLTAEDNSINLLGDMSANVDMKLHATNTHYYIDPTDTIRFYTDKFEFNDIRIHDERKQTGVVNGWVTHHNMKNFAYQFDVDINDLTIYDEREFNSDKFMATVYANGNLYLNGADGRQMQINADITPTKGSSFAYDTSAPDAVSTNNFITFHDGKEKENISIAEKTSSPSPSTKNNSPKSYSSDIFMDINMHINPNCAIKLKMDNAEDGYITTYGTGDLLAHYHNKGPFTLNGTYNISSGKYRLYLQDIIYRDLDLQRGSKAVFNGNPFDANINLLCWHTLNAVPLRDLTPSTTLQNNKVKVICELDITGKLDNMNVGFNLQMPNVSDETRQLVKSLISTEEEMNMQMIYLLGLGRFYTSEYARANGETGTGQAVNSLLSSTISGQVNQMLDNVIGSSNWNFGTGLSTGETGWNDLDVEGTLSGRLLNDRLLINGNFGYRDNALTNKANFIGDFDVKYQLRENGNMYVKAYNQTNDKYFTKATLNTQGIGISYQRSFNSWKDLLKQKTIKQK